MHWIQLLRIHQWPKNAFVLAALLFGQRWSDPMSLRMAGLAFLLFCFASSMVYIWNDLLDRDEDRKHPRKKHRPLASGRVQPATAWAVLAVGLVTLIPLTTWTLFEILPHLLAYLMLNLVYSTWGKHRAVFDILLIASGFMLRVVAGAAAIEVPASSWLLLCSGALAFFLATGKRRLDHEHSSAAHLYHRDFLDRLLQISATSALIFYGLYCNERDVLHPARFSFLWTMPPVLFGLLHYLRRIPEKDNRDLLLDIPLVVALFVWLLVCWGLLS